MKVRMKKRFIGLLLGICLVLGACGEPVQHPDTTEPPVETTEAVVEAAYDVLPVEENYYQYGNILRFRGFTPYSSVDVRMVFFSVIGFDAFCTFRETGISVGPLAIGNRRRMALSRSSFPA